MITFLPDHQQDYFCFRAYENGEELGFCTYKNEGYRMVFLSMECENDITAEGLARAAMNYAANRNAYIAKIKKEMFSLLLKFFGFGAVGLMISAILLLPIFIVFMGSSRTDVSNSVPIIYNLNYYENLFCLRQTI